MHVLCADVFKAEYSGEQPIPTIMEGRFSHIATVKKPAVYKALRHTSSSSSSSYYEDAVSHDVNHKSVQKVRISPGEEGFPMPNDEPFSHIYLEGCQLRERSNHSHIEPSDLSRQFIYKSNISLRRLRLIDSRLIGVSGNLEQMELNDCQVVPGKGLKMLGIEWMGGDYT